MPAPSPITKPSRPWSKGRLASVGSSLRVDIAFMLAKPATAMGVMVDSVPPQTIASARSLAINRAASPIACAPEAQAETVQ